MKALIEKNELVNNPELKQQMLQTIQFIAATELEHVTIVKDFQIDVSNMQAVVIEDSARRTVVELTGEIGIMAAGERMTMDIEELILSEGGNAGDNQMTLIVQDSRWVVCST